MDSSATVVWSSARAVEGRVDHFALDRPLHVGDLLRPLVHEHDHEVAFRVVLGDRVGDRLQDHRLARLGRRHDEPALALADRADQVDDPRGQHAGVGLQAQPVLRVQRHQLGELRPGPGGLRVEAVHLVQPDQGVELLPPLAVARLAHRALDDVALAQAVPAHLGQGHVHVVGPGQVAGGADERVVVEHVEDARDRDEHVILGDHRLGLAGALATAPVAVAEPVPVAPAARGRRRHRGRPGRRTARRAGRRSRPWSERWSLRCSRLALVGAPVTLVIAPLTRLGLVASLASAAAVVAPHCCCGAAGRRWPSPLAGRRRPALALGRGLAASMHRRAVGTRACARRSGRPRPGRTSAGCPWRRCAPGARRTGPRVPAGRDGLGALPRARLSRSVWFHGFLLTVAGRVGSRRRAPRGGIVKCGAPRSRSARRRRLAALPALDRLDELALAHPAYPGDAHGLGQPLQFGQQHAGQSTARRHPSHRRPAARPGRRLLSPGAGAAAARCRTVARADQAGAGHPRADPGYR